MIKVLLFDSDGVLAHTEELFFEINRKIFGEMGVDYPRSEFEHHTFLTSLGTTGFMRTKGFSDEDVKQFKIKRDTLWQAAIMKKSIIDPVAEEVFEALKQHYRIGIVTNTNKDNFTRAFHGSRIPQLANFVVVREDYKNGKPEPDGYLRGLEVSDCKPGEALVIEDSPRGITAAKAAGIKVVAIPNPVIKNLETSQADYHLSSLSELPNFLVTLS
jgi:HAD superfamily hydrolase (TIGR01509 family)